MVCVFMVHARAIHVRAVHDKVVCAIAVQRKQSVRATTVYAKAIHVNYVMIALSMQDVNAVYARVVCAKMYEKGRASLLMCNT